MYFHFRNTWTIPKEMFIEQSGIIYFVVASIHYDMEEEKHMLRSSTTGVRGIRYNKINEQTLMLKEG